MPDEPEALGLLALMLLHDARRAGPDRRRRRPGHAGRPGPLAVGPRREIDEGTAVLDRALRRRRAGPLPDPGGHRGLPRHRGRARRTPTGRRSPASTGSWRGSLPDAGGRAEPGGRGRRWPTARRPAWRWSTRSTADGALRRLPPAARHPGRPAAPPRPPAEAAEAYRAALALAPTRGRAPLPGPPPSRPLTRAAPPPPPRSWRVCGGVDHQKVPRSTAD